MKNPAGRDEALAAVAVPLLAERMSVPSTERIPTVKVRKSVVIGSSEGSAVVVSTDQTGAWWFVQQIRNPISGQWAVQRYERATRQMVRDAQKVIEQQEESDHG